MANLLSLVKAARGGLSPDAMIEMLSGMGVDVKFDPLDMKSLQAADEFRLIAGAALEPGAKVIKLSATMQDGKPLLAVMVFPEQ
jgi:hypothetical protein